MRHLLNNQIVDLFYFIYWVNKAAMECKSIFIGFMILFVFLISLLEVGYSIYEAYAFMESPDYIATCLHPNQVYANGSQFCQEFTLLSESYRR